MANQFKEGTHQRCGLVLKANSFEMGGDPLKRARFGKVKYQGSVV